MAFTQASSTITAQTPTYATHDADHAMRGVGGIVPSGAPDVPTTDSELLRQLKQANPGLRIARFEVANP